MRKWYGIIRIENGEGLDVVFTRFLQSRIALLLLGLTAMIAVDELGLGVVCHI
ncbi:MAG: hypothetical protein OEX77_00380 [Candidatus Bathyarchaeota archaeon]|nr:hypothetical protein [Candidatus Bathyarchaeota archaeon]MDH5732269.1 hypothetical protein [Candidatus Bathyarchaeota archaeon]